MALKYSKFQSSPTPHTLTLAQVSRSYLAQWAIQVCLSLMLDFLFLQFVTATLLWFLLHRLLAPAAGSHRPRALLTRLRENVVLRMQAPASPTARGEGPGEGEARPASAAASRSVRFGRTGSRDSATSSRASLSWQ